MLYNDGTNLSLKYINVVLIIIGFMLSLGIAYGYYLISVKNQLNKLKIMVGLVVVQGLFNTLFSIGFVFSDKTDQIILLNNLNLITIGLVQLVFGIILYKVKISNKKLIENIGILYIFNGVLFLTVIFGFFSYFVSFLISVCEIRLFYYLLKESK